MSFECGVSSAALGASPDSISRRVSDEEGSAMTEVMIDWDSLSIHRGTLTVLLRGDWAHDASWTAFFNDEVPPLFSTSWGQVAASASNLHAWGHVVAKDDGVITVHALSPGHAGQLREALERYVAAANKKIASLSGPYHRVGPRDSQHEEELDERDRALMDEFRQLQLASR